MRHGDEPRGGRPVSKEEEERRLKSLMSDLETSIASFDERFSDIGDAAAPPNYNRFVEAGNFPEIDPDARREVAPTAQRALRGADTGEEGLPDGASEAERNRHAAFDIGRALQQAADYLQGLTTQLNPLQPATPLRFAIDDTYHFRNVRWQEGNTRTATRSASERSLIEKLTLRVRYAADPLSFVAAGAATRRIENELYLTNLAWRDGGVELSGQVAGRRIDVDGTIPLQLAFTADVGARRILLRCRNLGGLGLSAFAIAPAAIDHVSLDELGRRLLGQGRQLSADWRPIPFNTPDSPA